MPSIDYKTGGYSIPANKPQTFTFWWETAPTRRTSILTYLYHRSFPLIRKKCKHW